MQRPSTVGGMVGTILTELPEVGLSFFLSGGSATVAKKGLKKGIDAALSKGIQDKIQKNLLTRGITKVAGAAVTVGARTPVAAIPFAPRDFVDRLTPDINFTANEKRELSMIVTGEGKDVPEAFKETLLNSYIEVASEMVGGAFKPLGQGVKQVMVKSAFARAMLNANPTKKVAELGEMVKKVGYHGPLGEMLEERGADHLEQVVMIQCVGSRNEKNPNCSRVCCQGAIKNALHIKELNPDADVFILYRDIPYGGMDWIAGKISHHLIKLRLPGHTFLIMFTNMLMR